MSDGDITIITTIHPAKKGHRAVTVMAAPDGEMPVCRTGLFAERHQLVDQAYGELLRRKPQAVKAAGAVGSKAGKAKTKSKQLPGHTSPSKVADVLERASGQPGFGQPGHLPARTAEADQIGPDSTDKGTPSPAIDEPDDLPVIEGDDQAQLELEGMDG
jgi:hypothetical protein